MFTDYVFSFHYFLDDQDIENLVLHANNLGLNGFKVLGLYIVDDSDGKHIYFQIDDSK